MAGEPNRFRRQVLVNTLSTGFGNGWAIVVSVVSLPLLLHGMGATAFGTWVLIQTFSAVSGWFSLADVGVGTAATRAVAERASVGETDDVDEMVSSALSVFAGLGVVSAALLALVGPFVLPDVFRTPAALHHAAQVAIVFFGIQLLFDLLTEGSEACLEGLQRVDLSREVDAVRRTVVAVATVVVAQVNGHLAAVALASLAASVGGTLVGAVVLRRQLPGRLVRPSRQHVRELISYGKTVAVLRPLGVINRTMDRLIVGIVLGPAAVSLVEIATQIMNGADAVLSASSYAVVPGAAWLGARGDRDTLRELLHRGTKYSMLVTVPVAAGAAILAHPLVHVWLGPRYEAAAGLAAVALMAELAAAPVQVGSNLLLGIGKAGEILRAAAIAVGLNLALSLLLVHLVGIVGAFEATLVASAVLVPLLMRAALRAVGSTWPEFLREVVLPAVPPTLALAAAAGAALLLPVSDLPTLVIGAAAGGAAYLAVALRWSVHRSEVDELRGLLRRPSQN